MKSTQLLYLAAIGAGLFFSNHANAQASFNGGVALGGSGPVDSTSITLGSLNLFQGGTGSFANVTADFVGGNTTPISGISSSAPFQQCSLV